MDIEQHHSKPAEDLSRFKLNNSGEIERILRTLMEKKVLVSGSEAHGKNSFVTIVLAVDQQNHQFYLECPLDSKVDAAIQSKEGAHFVARQDGVEMRFVVGQGKRVDYQGGPAYRLPLPTEFYRIQRREFYRVEVSRAKPATFRIPVSEGRAVEGTVLDVSIGGLGLDCGAAEPMVMLGEIYGACEVNIPEVGKFSVGLRVQKKFEKATRSGGKFWLMGCEFVKLPATAERDLQRYIFKIQRDRLTQG